MRALPWWKHLLIALVATVGIFAVFTVLLRTVIDTEEFSGQVYFIASILLLVACIRLQRTSLAWVYWLIFALCVMIFLDEVAYGVELIGFEPIYIERYNFYVRDLHSSIGFAGEVLAEWLPQAGWNPALFQSLARFNLVLGLCAAASWWLVRRGLAARVQAAWQAGSLRFALLASLLTSLAALAYLLLLPADPKNALLLGLSASRLGAVLVLLACAGLAAWGLRSGRLPTPAATWLQRHALLTSLVLALLFFGAIAYQLYASFTFLPDELVRLQRVLPLVLWAQAQAMWLWLGVQLYTGRLHKSITEMVREGLQALKENPAFIYVGVAVCIIFIAQLLDQNYIPLDDMLYTPSLPIQYWAGWTEETLEMIGGFLFAMAALVMPRKQAKA